MSYEAFRQKVVTEVASAMAQHPQPVPVEYPNRNTVDLAVLNTPYVVLDLVYMGGQQKDLSNKPLLGFYGQIQLMVGVKENTGTSEANKYLEYLEPFLEMKDWPEGVIGAPEPQRERSVKGWVYYPVIFNFTRYRHTAY